MKFKIKYCKYCGKLISKNGVKGCCTIEEAILWKQQYNADYYERTRLNNLIVKHSQIFKNLIDVFGEGTDILASILDMLGMDWELETDRIMINGIEYVVIGNYAYVVLKSQKVKIIRL